MSRLTILQEARQNTAVTLSKIDHYLGGDMVHNNHIKSLDAQSLILAIGGVMAAGVGIAVMPALILPATGVGVVGATALVFNALYKKVRGIEIASEHMSSLQLDNKHKVMLKDGQVEQITLRDMYKQLDAGTFYNKYHAVEAFHKGTRDFYQPQSMAELLRIEGHSNPLDASKRYAKAIAMEEKGMVKAIVGSIASMREKVFGNKNDMASKNTI